jgi:hypothetical protein
MDAVSRLQGLHEYEGDPKPHEMKTMIGARSGQASYFEIASLLFWIKLKN